MTKLFSPLEYYLSIHYPSFIPNMNPAKTDKPADSEKGFHPIKSMVDSVKHIFHHDTPSTKPASTSPSDVYTTRSSPMGKGWNDTAKESIQSTADTAKKGVDKISEPTTQTTTPSTSSST